MDTESTFPSGINNHGDLARLQDPKKKRKRHSFDENVLKEQDEALVASESKRPKPNLDQPAKPSPVTLAPGNLDSVGPCPHSPRKSGTKKAYSRLSSDGPTQQRRRFSGTTFPGQITRVWLCEMDHVWQLYFFQAKWEILLPRISTEFRWADNLAFFLFAFPNVRFTRHPYPSEFPD
jgi:hypothetical protein